MAFNESGQRKFIENFTSNAGETKQDFIDRLGKRVYTLTQDEEVEHCANICEMTDPTTGSISFSAEIKTDHNPVQCGTKVTECAPGFSPAGDAIHVHPNRYKITEELRKFDPR